ncbi:MAG TPA: FAD-dependent oxidoreductase [Trebonia sp.]|nr:FAD-dependent oxidoreductase [Trebonia sp.]
MAEERTGRRVAVVGSGIAGLTAAYLLRRCCEVTLFEADTRLGGHAHTHELAAADGRVHRADSGFIVHNGRAYPLLRKLFAELGVQTQPAGMSMSISCAGCGLQYAGGRGPRGMVAGIPAGSRAAFLRLLTEIRRFYRAARALAGSTDGPGDCEQTFGEFLAAGGYSSYFVRHFARPIVSSLWSSPPSAVFDYPVAYLSVFLANHGFLSARRSFAWRTVTGGSATYVDRIAERIPRVLRGTAVRGVRRLGDRVELHDVAGRGYVFDAAVIAAHPDQALALLERPTAGERDTLGAFRYTANTVALHADTRLLPRHPAVRASWNYQQDSCEPSGPARISYDLTRLQRLPTADTYLVTLNPAAPIRPGAVRATMTYEHPLYTPASLAAQRRLPSLNDGRLAFAGAYHGWGFHEDGCRSGAAAALSLGGSW